MDDGEPYLVFSLEHRAWWRAKRAGYCRDVMHAGRYSRKDAMTICADAVPGTAVRLGLLPELPVRLSDLAMIRELTPERWRDAALLGVP